MSNVCLSLALIVLLLMGNSAGWAGSLTGDNLWRWDHERGWFFYEDPPIEEPEPEPEPIAPNITAQPETPAGPPALSAQWLRDNLENYQIKAIDNPTPENIEMYLYLQRVMMDKAQRFTEGFARAVQFDPYLDQNTRRPLSSFGGAESARIALKAKREVLTRIAQQAGIFFFFKSTCEHCEIQAPLLKNLQEIYGFKVFPVSLDGMPLHNDLFGSFERDQGQAQKLGVVQTPAMFLGRPNTREVLLIAQSTMAQPQLEERIIEAAIQAGWIDQKEYQSTKGWNSWMALDLKQNQVPQGLDDKQLLEYMKRMYTVQAALGMGSE
ncbi:MAG: conjugal transfer protein TraF [Desulfobaccales bacterium]